MEFHKRHKYRICFLRLLISGSLVLHVVNAQSLDDSGLKLPDESDNVIEGEIEKTVDKLQGKHYYLTYIIRFNCRMCKVFSNSVSFFLFQILFCMKTRMVGMTWKVAV